MNKDLKEELTIQVCSNIFDDGIKYGIFLSIKSFDKKKKVFYENLLKELKKIGIK